MRWRRCEGRSHLAVNQHIGDKCIEGLGLTTPGKLIVDLFLEEQHIFPGKLPENTQDALATEKAIEAGVAVGVVLRAAEHSFPLSIYFLSHLC